MNTHLISIGDELLIGQVINTNASWLAQTIKDWGLITSRIVSVSDKSDEIIKVIKEAKENAEFAIITGGLGPTKDDITKAVLCEIFNSRLVINEEVLQHIKSIFNKRILPLSELNIKQAEVPDNAHILFNELGTAPGMLFMDGNFTLVSLPGVPHEMKNIVNNKLKPLILSKYKLPTIVSENVMICGIPESFLAEKIEIWENSLTNQGLSLAYLP
jgi:nicotinamide-nucleotide amidase